MLCAYANTMIIWHKYATIFVLGTLGTKLSVCHIRKFEKHWCKFHFIGLGQYLLGKQNYVFFSSHPQFRWMELGQLDRKGWSRDWGLAATEGRIPATLWGSWLCGMSILYLQWVPLPVAVGRPSREHLNLSDTPVAKAGAGKRWHLWQEKGRSKQKYNS